MGDDKVNAGELLVAMPWDRLLKVADDKKEEGSEEDDVVNAVIDEIDDIVDLSKLFPGPGGILLETLDGPIIKGIAGLVTAIAGDEEARKARRARRELRRKERHERRDERRKERIARKKARRDARN